MVSFHFGIQYANCNIRLHFYVSKFGSMLQASYTTCPLGSESDTLLAT